MVRRYSIFKVRRRPGPANLPGSPSDITPTEQSSALSDVEDKIRVWNRKYASRIVHNATPIKKQEARHNLLELEAEKRSLQNMQPIRAESPPGHVQRAERSA